MQGGQWWECVPSFLFSTGKHCTASNTLLKSQTLPYIKHQNFGILEWQKGYKSIFKMLDYLLESFQLLFFKIFLKEKNEKQVLIAVCPRTLHDCVYPLLSLNESGNQIQKFTRHNNILKVLWSRINSMMKPHFSVGSLFSCNWRSFQKLLFKRVDSFS